MDIQGYNCAANLRLRASMVLSELAYWHDWAGDEEDTALIEQLATCLKTLHRKKSTACLAYDRTRHGWDNPSSANIRVWEPLGDGPPAAE